MSTLQQRTINNRVRARRDVLDILSNTKDKLSRKDLVLLLSAKNGGKMDYPYAALVHALRELVRDSKIKREWAWGVAGNWEYRYSFIEAPNHD